MFLKTKDKNANFEMIETHRQGATTFGVISAQNEISIQAIENQAKELGYSILGTCVRDGRPTLAIATDKSEKEVVSAISGGKPLEEVKVPKPPNIWFYRGLMGLVGQVFTLSHAKLVGDNALGTFAYLNIAANGMAMGLGAQKTSDEATLKRLNNEFDHLTTEGGGRADVGKRIELAEAAHRKAHPDEAHDEVAKDKQGVMGSIRSNSVKIQHTLRLIASGIVFRDGLKKFNETGKMSARLIAGGLILPGKIIGILAQDEDPNKLPQEKKGFWASFKSHANQIGSLVELTGFTLMAYEGVSKNHTITADKAAVMKPGLLSVSKKLYAEKGWMQAIGQTLFVLSYMVQSVAPLSKKIFPTERALQSASLHLQTVTDDERDQTAVSMAHQMYSAVPKMRQEGLAKTLAQIYSAARLPVNGLPSQSPSLADGVSQGADSGLGNQADAVTAEVSAAIHSNAAVASSPDNQQRPTTTNATRALGEEAAPQSQATVSYIEKVSPSAVEATPQARLQEGPQKWQSLMQEQKHQEENREAVMAK